MDAIDIIFHRLVVVGVEKVKIKRYRKKIIFTPLWQWNAHVTNIHLFAHLSHFYSQKMDQKIVVLL